MELNIRFLGEQPYVEIWQAMQQWTQERAADTIDELWILEHPSVYTQGYAGRAEHILQAVQAPIVQTDRGGQITYHNRGQLIIYTLFDLRRLKCHVQQLVRYLESITIDVLATFGLKASTKSGAPGIYIDGHKIGSIGLRVKRGCTYHGLALNICNDLRPFAAIRPCGLADIQMTNLNAFHINTTVDAVAQVFINHLQPYLDYTTIRTIDNNLPVKI